MSTPIRPTTRIPDSTAGNGQVGSRTAAQRALERAARVGRRNTDDLDGGRSRPGRARTITG